MAERSQLEIKFLDENYRLFGKDYLGNISVKKRNEIIQFLKENARCFIQCWQKDVVI